MENSKHKQSDNAWPRRVIQRIGRKYCDRSQESKGTLHAGEQTVNNLVYY